MDANLFGSFSRSQNQRRRRSSSQKEESSTAKPSPTSNKDVGQGEAVSKLGNAEGSSKDSDKTIDTKSILKSSEKLKSKKSFGRLFYLAHV